MPERKAVLDFYLQSLFLFGEGAAGAYNEKPDPKHDKDRKDFLDLEMAR
ncbi:hypothetical protein ACFL9T_06845 [Thermodesulfobacteriota bacterium]